MDVPANDPAVEGIPPELTVDFCKRWVRSRVSEKRYKHIAGVAEVARKLAQLSGCDTYLAELASWLHDACKEVSDKELVARAQEFGLQLSPIEKAHGHVLHGPVGAETVRAELGLQSKVVLDAIREHTLGAAPMSLLSKVVFLADCLEEGRPQSYSQPIWEALQMEGRLDLDRSILVACDMNLKDLIAGAKLIHPRTVEVRNYYLQMLKMSKPVQQ